MLLSHHYRFILIRPLKIAGSSAESALSKFLKPNDFASRLPRRSQSQVDPGVQVRSAWCWQRTQFYRPVRIRSHTFLRHVYAVFPEQVQDYRVISLTRNPWDRAVSRFFFKNRRTDMRDRDFATQRQAFIRFTHRWGPHTFLDNVLRLKRERALDNSRRLYFIDGECRADYVIRFEHIERDMNGLKDYLGLPEEPTVKNVHLLRHTRPATKKHRWVDFYDDATRDLVAKCCQWEIEQFGYDFEGKAELKGPVITHAEPFRKSA